ncbi:MAG: chloride channel protein [Candidatus Cryptobacteroides sp.]|nr:chloride channel protein [Bacteroidales bacterium]MDY6158851.1 chloride channel protein [Candidatus Cryptobacteroides sp.]
MLKFSEHNTILLLSFIVGVLSGCAAVILDWAIEQISFLLNGNIWNSTDYEWSFLVLPGVGMFISLLLLKFVVRDNIGHGVTKVLLAVSRNESKIKPHNTWSSVLTSSFTIGFGGSVGAEAPIVYTGAAIGSNIGRICHLSYRNITLLLGCGAAGAVAGIFKAPLAGVLFTMEILLFNVSMTTMLPLLLSTISATVISYIFRGQTPVFACQLTSFSMPNIPFYILLGIAAGLFSLYFTNGTLWLEDKLAKFRNDYVKWIFCALGLGMLIFLFPPLYGQGYDSLHSLLNGHELVLERKTILSFLMRGRWGVPLFFLLILFFKIVAMTLTNSGGGVGGTFGPTLFSGAILGFVVARCFNLLGAAVPEQNFVLVGMAALMAGVMQAPMTAIFLIAEISGGYELLIPLIITSTVSFGTVRIFEKYSIYTKRIAQSGDLLTHDNDQAVLTLMHTNDLIRDKYPKVQIDASLREVVDIIRDSEAAVLAVIDGNGRFQGMVDVAASRKYLFSPDKYDSVHVYNMMETPPEYIFYGEKMDTVMNKFEKTGAWRLPVVDRDTRKYLGFISKSRLLMAYRTELKEISVED